MMSYSTLIFIHPAFVALQCSSDRTVSGGREKDTPSVDKNQTVDLADQLH